MSWMNIPNARRLRKPLWTLLIVAVLASPTPFLGAAIADAISGDESRAIIAYDSFDDVPADALLEARGIDVLYRFKAIPAIGVSGAASDITNFASDPGFDYIEWDQELQWFLNTATFTTGAAHVWGDAWWPNPADLANAPPALTKADGTPIDGRGITIGVVDSGVNALHPDLWYAPATTGAEPWEPKVLECVKVIPVLGTSDPADYPYCDETVGHGTHVAGIAAGNGWAARNGMSPTDSASDPYVGVAPGANLIVAGTGAGIFILDAVSGLDWMYDMHTSGAYNLTVINNSYGNGGGCGGGFTSGTSITISNRLIDEGVTMVWAAGNTDPLTGADQINSPEGQNPKPGSISVANYIDNNIKGNRNGAVASSSADGCYKGNSASTADYLWTWPDVAAPGTSIVSTAAYTGSIAPPTWSPPWYANIGGTSMAAPHVAGLVALMKQANPDLTPAEIENIIVQTATPWSDGTTKRQTTGTTMWGDFADNNPADGYAKPETCYVKPADAAKAAAGDTSINAKFPRFTEMVSVWGQDPDNFVCRDFQRGRGLVDAYAAVKMALNDTTTPGDPVVTIDQPTGTASHQVPVAVSGQVDRDGNVVGNAAPDASLSADTTGGLAPLDVTFTVAATDADGDSMTWSLDFGDGSPADGGAYAGSTPVSHTYSNVGTYTATLTVTDDKGADDLATIAIDARANTLPQPDGTIDSSIFAYNAGGTGISNVAALVMADATGDNVPKYIPGETITIEARSTASQDAAVPVNADTPVSFYIFNDAGDIEYGPVATTGVVEGATSTCAPNCFNFRAGEFTIPADWAGRYYLAFVHTDVAGDHWFRDTTHNGLKPIDVNGAALPDGSGSTDDDGGHSIGDANDDGTAPHTEIYYADVSVDTNNVNAVLRLGAVDDLQTGDSPFIYGLHLNGRSIYSAVLVDGPTLWDPADGGSNTGGTTKWDAAASEVTISVPRSYLDGFGADCPCTAFVTASLGTGFAGFPVPGHIAGDYVDRAPNTGGVEAKAAWQPSAKELLSLFETTSGSQGDPEAVDGTGDAAAPFIDITKMWIDNEDADSFDIVMEVDDLSGQPPSTPAAAIIYQAGFCTDSNAITYSGTSAYTGLTDRACYGLAASNAVTGATFSGSAKASTNNDSCGPANNPYVDPTTSEFNVASGQITWTVLRDALNVDATGTTVADCSSVTRTGTSAVDGTTISRLSGSTGSRIGNELASVSYSPTQVFDATDGASARDYTLGTGGDPLVADAGGPYNGLTGAAIPVSASGSGGTGGPYTCTWSGSGATFAHAGDCDTTVEYASTGAHQITVDLTDGTDNAQGVATVTVSDTPGGAERVEVYVDSEVSPRGTDRTTTDGANPTDSWSTSIDLSDKAGQTITLTARWFDADNTLLDEDSRSIQVSGGGTGSAVVEIQNPTDDPAGTNAHTGTIQVSGIAGHDDVGAGAGASSEGLNFYGFPIDSGSRGGLRATALSGTINAMCAPCSDPVINDGTGLYGSATWWAGPDGNGVDGYWFDITGYAGATFELDSQFDEVTGIYFFNDWASDPSTAAGSDVSGDEPKTGTVPAGANWAFVFLQDHLAGSFIPLLEQVTLTLSTQVVPPSAPQNLEATAGDGEVSLTWQAPSNDGGELLGYNVYVNGAAYQTTTARSLTVSGLTNDQSYDFDVGAYNSAGETLHGTASATPTGTITPPGGLHITSPADGAADVDGDTVIAGDYNPGSGGGSGGGGGNFANTHYFFLMNLNDPAGPKTGTACSQWQDGDLGHGDILIAQKIIDHAKEDLGLPAANVHFFNEDGGKLCKADDDGSGHYDQLHPEYQDGSAFAGAANLDNFANAMAAATASAAASEAAGGPPARVFIMHSSHGLQNPANCCADGAFTPDRALGSMMVLWGDDVSDKEFGDRITGIFDTAETTHGVDIEVGVLIDCSFCGGFADSPLWTPGSTTTEVDSANVVGDNRVVEVGCTWITECWGNPAITYDYMFNICTFGTGAADGYGPFVPESGVANPLMGGSGDHNEDYPISDANHHDPDGVITLEEAYWCALDEAQQAGAIVSDPLALQQIFQLVDQMDADMFTDDGFVLWDIDGDDNLGGADYNVDLQLQQAGRGLLGRDSRASAGDPEGDALTPYGDLTNIDATATATDVVVDLTVADLSLSEQELEDVVEYRFTINGDDFGVCYSLGAISIYGYDIGADGAGSAGTGTYDFATGVVHVEIPQSELNDATIPATVSASSRYAECSSAAPVPDDVIPDSGTISTSSGGQPPVNPGADEVRLALTGPGGATAAGNAVLDSAAGTWTFDPVGTLAAGSWTAAAEHHYDDGTGFVLHDGPVSVTFTVGSGGDTEAPSQVTGLGAASAGTNAIDLTWSPATDNVGVTGYNLYRGLTSGNLAFVTSVTGTSHQDAGLAADTTYYYAVSAFDAAANEGAQSGAASATTDAIVGPTETLTVAVDGDVFYTTNLDTGGVGTTTWSSTLDTTLLADGAHTLTAEYDDGAGGSAFDSITIHTANGGDIRIDEPTDGSQVYQDFTASGEFSTQGALDAPSRSNFLLPDGVVNQDHFAVANAKHPAIVGLNDLLADATGFLGAYPALDGSSTVKVFFTGDAPASLEATVLPEGWTLDVQEDVDLQTQRLPIDMVIDTVSRRDGAPAPEPSFGIGPGTYLNQVMPTGTFGCTANFVWKDVNSGKYYLGAAGHCFLPAGTTATHGPAADYDPAKTTVSACLRACAYGGQSGFILQGNMVELGEVVYARQTGTGGDVGNDFGLVEIPEEYYGNIRTHMTVWEGPYDETDASLGDIVVLYGNSVGFGEHFYSKARAGIAGGLSNGGDAWRAYIPSFQGDSGAALNDAYVDSDGILHGDNAIGELTHVSCCNTGGVITGNTMDRSKEMALNDAGITIELVKQGDTISSDPVAPGEPTSIVATPGNGQVSIAWGAPVSDGGATVTDYTVKWGTSAGTYTDSQSGGLDFGETIAGLTNGQTYYFTVSATNSVGEGNDGSEVSATPQTSATAPDAPGNVQVVAGDGAATLQWDAPNNNGAPITGYTVYYGTTSGSYTASTNTGATNTVVSGLSNDVTYYFVVTASNAIGTSPQSGEVSATPTAGPPSEYFVEVRADNSGGQVQDWTSATTVSGSWSYDFGGMPLGDLTVTARLRDTTTTLDSDDVDVTVILANSAPSANAGSDQSVESGETAYLNAGGSSDPDGDDLTYLWSQLSGTPVVLSDAATVQASFDVARDAGVMVFEVTVTDEHGLMDTDTTTVSSFNADELFITTIDGVAYDPADEPYGLYEGIIGVAGTAYASGGASGTGPVNSAPTACIQGANANALTFTAASCSTDPDAGDTITLHWDFGDGTTASGTNVAHTYATAGTRTITLTATDNHGASGQTNTGPLAFVQVTSGGLAADAGDSQFVRSGNDVILSGAAFEGTGPYTFAWDTNGDGAYETAGQSISVTGLAAGAYDMTLQVADSASRTATDTVRVQVYDNTVVSRTDDQEVILGLPDETEGIVPGGTVDGESYEHKVTVAPGATVLDFDLTWDSYTEIPQNGVQDGGISDYDLYVYNPSGTEAGNAADFDMPETVAITDPVPGEWTAVVHSYVAVMDTYHLAITTETPPSNPMPTIVDDNQACFSTSSQNLAVAVDGVAPSVTWDTNFDGTFGDASGTSITTHFPLDGTSHLVRARVEDSGFRATVTIAFTVASQCSDAPAVVVVAVADTGVNAYNKNFEGIHVPYPELRDFTTTDPDNMGPGDVIKRDGNGDMLPFTRHPANYIPGFPADATALDITLGAYNAGIDSAVWTRANIPMNEWFWIPGTKIIGALDGSDANPVNGGGADVRPILDDGGHGTGSTSVAVGNQVGSCKRCLLVFAEGLSSDTFFFGEKWIDFVSVSGGSLGNVPSTVGIANGGVMWSNVNQLNAAERGQTISYAAGNGCLAYLCVEQTYLSNDLGPDWTLNVGAVTTGGSSILQSGKPVDWSGYASGHIPRAGTNSYDNSGSFSGTSAATPIATGHMASALLEARLLLGDELAGQKAPADAGGQLQAIAVGSPVPGVPELADGVLQRHELWDISLHCASSLGGSVNYPGTGPGTAYDYAYAGYGIADNAAQNCAIAHFTTGAAVPSHPDADEFFETDETIRDTLYGDWDGDGDGADGGNFNTAAGSQAIDHPDLDIVASDVDTFAEVSQLIADLHAMMQFQHAPPVTETYYLHKNGCGAGEDNTQFMDHAPTASQEAGHGCGNVAATNMNQAWSSSETAENEFAAGSSVTATIRGFTYKPTPGDVLTGQLHADGVLVGQGASAPVDVIGVLDFPTPCHEWVISFPTTDNIPSGANLILTVTSELGSQDRPMCYEGGAGASRVSITGSGGGGGGGNDPAASIDGPADASEFDLGTVTNVPVTGTATFPGDASDTAFYLHRDACADSSDRLFLDDQNTAGDSNGCAFIDGASAPARPGFYVETYDLDAAFLPLQLAQGGVVGGTVYFGTQGADAFEGIVRVSSDAGLIGQQAVSAVNAGSDLTDSYGSVEISIAVPDNLAGTSLGSLTLEIETSQQGAVHWTNNEDPAASFIELPLQGAPAGGYVEVAVDDVTFATNTLAVTGNEAWSADWDLGGWSAGDYTVYARACTPAKCGVADSVDVTLTEDGEPGSAQVQVTSAVDGAVPDGFAATTWDSETEDWSDQWNTADLPNGDVDYYVRLMVGTDEVKRLDFDATVRNPHPPTIAAGADDVTIAEGDAFTVTLEGSDLDSDDVGSLTFSLEDGPVGMTVTDGAGDTATLAWSPGYDVTTMASGSSDHTVTVRVNAANDGPTDTTFTVTVTDTNQAPILATIGDRAVNEDDALEFTVSASDPDADNTVSLSAADLPAGATFDGASGDFAWTPGYEDAGIYDVTFTADDGGLTDSETITISVGDVNRAPALATIGDQAGSEGSEMTFVVSASDPDGDNVAITATGLPSGATFDGATFTWTPGYFDAGAHAVTFTATDDGSPALDDTETISIVIANTNRAPTVAVPGDQVVPETEELTFTVSADDADTDDAAPTVTMDSGPAGSTFDGTTFTWTPTFDDAGSHTAIFTATDAHGLTDTDTVTITVGDVNRAPEFASTLVGRVNEFSTLQMELVASDPDGDSVSWSIDYNTLGIEFVDNEDGTATLTWQPTSDHRGVHALEVTITDDNADVQSRTGTLTITVDAIPGFTLERITSAQQTVPEGESVDLRFRVTNTWDESDTFDFASAMSVPGWTITAPGSITLAGGESAVVAATATPDATATEGTLTVTTSSGQAVVDQTMDWALRPADPVLLVTIRVFGAPHTSGDAIEGDIIISDMQGNRIHDSEITLEHWYEYLGVEHRDTTSSTTSWNSGNTGRAAFALDDSNAPLATTRGDHHLEATVSNGSGTFAARATYTVV